MNILPIIKKQKGLMDHIEKEHPTQPDEDRFKKRLLALAVEVGECANDWRGFKFWSKDQKPRMTLLEEYVDVLHFVVDIGVTKDFKFPEWEFPDGPTDIEGAFLEVFSSLGYLYDIPIQNAFESLLYTFFQLGASLGFTWDEVEQAYYHKNKVNHQRQENGY